MGAFAKVGVLACAVINRRSGGHLRMATDACGNAKLKDVQFKKNFKDFFDEFKENETKIRESYGDN